jgi:hypothetical protein
MKRLSAFALAALFCAPAMAQPTSTVTPAAITGFGTLAVLAASIPLSGLTLGPNSTAFPTGNLPNRQIEVKNAAGSVNVLFVCPMGGTCTTANGIPLNIGESKTWYLLATQGQLVSPTVISGGTATAVASW